MLARLPLFTSLSVAAAVSFAPLRAFAGGAHRLGDLTVSATTALPGVPCTVATEATDCMGENMGLLSRCSPATSTCIYAYETVTVTQGGTLIVTPVSASGAMPATTGWLSIQANTITVMSGGTITADGAGYPGSAGGAGQSPTMTNGGGAEGNANGLPGGGGGYFAPGAAGVITAPSCMPAPGANGGSAYFDTTTMALFLGSAGGAASASGATAGGAGGGGIELMAATIVIDGTVSAAGKSPFQSNGVGPGGGSGGSIRLFTASLSGAGTLSVAGGDGAVGPGIALNNIKANAGGGGSGGVILLSMPSPAMPPGTMTVDVAGGSTGTCTAGGAGMVVSVPLPGNCVDVDGDGAMSTACGGMDCDDADPQINPNAMEICNGIDDDCDGKVDEGTGLCTAPEVCSDGACVVPVVDAGVDSGPASDGGSLPDHVDYGGGIGAGCDVPAVPPGLPVEGAAALALAVGTVLLGASRRRPPRRP